MNTAHPLAHLADAGIVLALLLALAFGAPVEWIVGIFLALEVVGHVFKFLNALLEPLVHLVKRRSD